MPGKVENWEELRALYVIHNKSAREISQLSGHSNSTISARAKREDWDGQRIAYKGSIAQRGYENAAAVVANNNAEALRENILVARAYVRAVAMGIKDGSIKPNMKDGLEAMRFLVEQLAPAARETENAPRIIEGSGVRTGEGSDADFVRRLVEVARSRVAAPGGLGADPLDGPPRSRAN